jgi:hypothetical protein
MPVRGLQRHGEPTLVYGLRQCVRQFTHPVNEAQYGAIRALFISVTKVRPPSTPHPPFHVACMLPHASE